MKGPGLRIELDVRRTWRCPRCGGERRAGAHVTSLTCSCAPDKPQMQLVEGQRRVRPEPKPLDLVLNIDLDAPETDAGDAVVAPVIPATPVSKPPPGESTAAEPDDFGVGAPDAPMPPSDPAQGETET